MAPAESGTVPGTLPADIGIGIAISVAIAIGMAERVNDPWCPQFAACLAPSISDPDCDAPAEARFIHRAEV